MADGEMEPTVNPAHFQRSDLKPMEIVGAGPLTSAIWKRGNEQSGWHYRFNLVRQPACRGLDSEMFEPADLIHMVKLTQVLATVIADDGCLTQIERTTLKTLATELDDFLGGATVKMDVNASQTK